MDEYVQELYSDPEMVAVIEEMEENAANESQEYGLYEAILFDEI